jgi:hypothetical protein
MRRSSFSRLLSQTLLVLIITIGLSVAVSAQASSPAPVQSQAPAAGKTLSDNLAALAQRAGELIPYLEDHVETPLLDWFEKIAIVLAALVVMFGFARLWREGQGASADLFWWMGRLAVCLALLGTGPYLIDYLNNVGKEIAGGNQAIGDSVLSRFYKTQRDSIDQSYQKFTDGCFTVQVNGDQVPVPPGPDGTEAVLGVLFDKEATIKDINHRMDISSWNMPTLFSVLSFARGIIEFGDFYLILLGGFLLIAARLAAPFMIAMAADRQLAQRTTYPFVWGVVLRLIWPAVSYLIRGLAYMAGNMAMAVGDSQPLYRLDAATMQVISNPQTQPIYMIVIAAIVMGVAGSSLWISPYIAYRISQGQVYESVASTVSGWVGAIVGAGVELYSAQAAAAINNQAERTQTQGTYSGEVTRAEGAYEAGNLGVRARQIAAIASARGGQVAALAGIYGARTQATMSAQAGMLFGINSAAATTALSKGDIQVKADQSVSDLQVHRDQQSANIETNRSADTQQWAGDKLIRGSEWAGQFTRRQLSDKDGKGTLKGEIVGSAIELGGGALGVYEQYRSIQNRAAGQQGALNTATEGMINNQTLAAQGQTANQDIYFGKMSEAHQQYAQGQIAAANAGAAQAAGGVVRGTAITIGGINQSAALERNANRLTFDASVKAAGQVRDAAVEASRLHALSSVIHSVEQGLTMRY